MHLQEIHIRGHRMLDDFHLEFKGKSADEMHSLDLLVGGNELWRTVAFVDDDRWAEYVNTFHLPIMSNDQITLPEERKEGAIVNMDESLTSLWSTLPRSSG